MKTRVLKFATVFVLAVSLVVSFFAVPVSAADGDLSTHTFNFPLLSEDLLYFRWTDYVGANAGLNNSSWDSMNPPQSATVYDDDSVVYVWDWASGNENDRVGACSIFIGRSKFGVNSYSASDTIWCDPFSFYLIIPRDYSGATYFRISLRAVEGQSSIGKRVGSSDWIKISASNNGSVSKFKISVPRTFIRIHEAGDYTGLSVHLEFQCSSLNSIIGLGSAQSALTIHYGVGSSPNFPVYAPPDTTIVEELGQIEDEILSNTTIVSVESQMETIFSNLGSSLTIFVDGVKFASNCLNAFFDPPTSTLAWFRNFIQISLALGIAASLLGIAASIIGAASGGRKGKGD